MIGIIRKMDALGRVTFPAEYRKYLGLNVKDAVEICLEKDCIRIKPLRKEN